MAEQSPKPSTRELADRLYVQIRAIAGEAMRHERDGHTLQPTALVNEVFIRLANYRHEWLSDEHFIAAAVQVVRRVLVDHARSRSARKRPTSQKRADLDLATLADDPQGCIDLDDLLNALAAREPDAARVIELSVFGGLSMVAIAEILSIHERTARRYRAAGRAWILAQYTRMVDDPDA